MIQSVEHSCNLLKKKKNGQVPFLPQEEVMPIMPFHIILKDNLCFIPPFLGRGPNLQKKTQAKYGGDWQELCPDVGLQQLLHLLPVQVGQGRSHRQKRAASHLLFFWPLARFQTFSRPRESWGRHRRSWAFFLGSKFCFWLRKGNWFVAVCDCLSLTGKKKRDLHLHRKPENTWQSQKSTALLLGELSQL